MTQVGQRLTLDEFRAIPEQKPYLEYWNGQIVQKMAPQRDHWELQTRVTELLLSYRKKARGRIGTEASVFFDNTDEPRELIPDVAYWAPGKPLGGPVAEPPTLAVEIRSAGQSLNRLRSKCRYYVENGVEVAWLIDADSRTVDVFEADRDGEAVPAGFSLQSPHLPGLTIDTADLFAVLDES